MVLHKRLQDIIAPVVAAMDCDFWGLEFSPQGKRQLLRVYIDSENGVNVDDCARVSRQIEASLDVESPIPGEYVLEVSSPGMDRPLFTQEQFVQYLGHEVRVKLLRAFEGRRNFKGLLREVVDGELILVAGEDEFTLPLESVDSARVVPHF